MTKSSIHRRRPLLSVLTFIVALLTSLSLIALLQLDIGSYKQQLADQLEKVLDKPVRLGDVNLSFHNGIALDFRNLQIGGDNNFLLHVPQLSATLKLLALLRGEIVIEQVLLDAPSLKISLPLNLAESTINIDNLRLKTLQIRKGNLQISHAENQEKPVTINNFNMVIHGLGKGLVSQIATSATLFQTGQDAEFNLFIELTRQHLGQPWRQGKMLGEISLDNLRHDLPRNLLFSELPSQFNLNVGFQGTPADKVLIEAGVDDSKNGAPLFSLKSDWRSTLTVDSFQNLTLGWEGIPFTGQLQLNRKETDSKLTGQIKLGSTQIKDFLVKVKPLAKLSGKVDKIEISFDGPLHATVDNPLSPLQSASLKISNLSYPVGRTKLTDFGMLIELQSSRISLKNGQGTFAQTPFTFSGTSGLLNQTPPEIAFALNSTADLNKLQTEFSSPFLDRQTLNGNAPIDLIVQGPLNRLTTEFKIDLTNTELTLGKLLQKAQGVPSAIELNGQIEPDRLTINKALFNIAQASVGLTGSLARKNETWTGGLQLAPLSLETLQSVSPIFAFFKISGKTQGQLKRERSGEWEGQFSLKNGGAHLTQVLSDLNQVNGEIQLNKGGFDLGKIKARLGQSPINVTGGLRNWKSPLLSLQVTGNELRAQDLIFTNQQMMLQNLEGQLLISAGGITFDQIVVTVENRTTVKIAGMMRGYRAPYTYLEISSEKADILDVIQLFTGPQRIKQSNKRQHKARLEIKVSVKQGSLGNFLFENAKATIKDHNNVFTLFPLGFNLGKGTATGRVEIDKLRNNLLKISGQVVNCDADSVYQMLFEKRGIFRGTLSGDFYIEGEETGEQFWKTSQGGGHLQIKDGAMRGIKGFAQIFSLLNVSQLFAFRLPDMDKEGLPLSRLETSASIKDGILHFDDFSIVSPAINISAVGQLNSLDQTIDITLGIKPLRTVDIILSRVPLFGWILTGDEEALVTALFTLKGPVGNPKVSAAPVSSVTNTALGIIGRTLGLPFRMLQKTGEFLTTPPRVNEKSLFPKEATEN